MIILGVSWVAYFIYIGQFHEKIEEQFFLAMKKRFPIRRNNKASSI